MPTRMDHCCFTGNYLVPMELSASRGGVRTSGMTATANDVGRLCLSLAIGAAVFAALLCGAVTARMGALFEIGCHTWFPLSIGSGKGAFCYKRLLYVIPSRFTLLGVLEGIGIGLLRTRNIQKSPTGTLPSGAGLQTCGGLSSPPEDSESASTRAGLESPAQAWTPAPPLSPSILLSSMIAGTLCRK
jgi:hypothetical protein